MKRLAYMATPRILITGINGLIGGILRNALDGKYNVFGLDESGPFSSQVSSADIADYKQDDPTTDARNLRIWLSQRDLVQLVEKSLLTNVPFGIYYGISNNKGAFYDLSNARDEMGFVPADDASAPRE
jgi:hypothetical protein